MRILVAAALAAIAGTAAAQPPQVPPACASADHRALDFWVGSWDVYPTGKDKLVAHSLIENLYGGCAIRENWMPLKGGGGGSLSSWDPAAKAWRQTWVDSSGETVMFEGGMNGAAMVMTAASGNAGGPGKPGRIRMTYTAEPGGSVRQRGEASVDGGKTWQPSYDFTYKPAAARPVQAGTR
jgi:hypothetical protein